MKNKRGHYFSKFLIPSMILQISLSIFTILFPHKFYRVDLTTDLRNRKVEGKKTKSPVFSMHQWLIAGQGCRFWVACTADRVQEISTWCIISAQMLWWLSLAPSLINIVLLLIGLLQVKWWADWNAHDKNLIMSLWVSPLDSRTNLYIYYKVMGWWEQ